MRNVEQILSELEDQQRIADTRLDEVPYGIRPSAGIAKTAAQGRVKSLRAELEVSTIPKRLVGVFMDSDLPRVVDLASFLRDNDGLVISPRKIYEEMADFIEVSYGRERVFGITQFTRLLSDYVGRARDLGFDEVPGLTFKEKVCFDRNATIEHVRDIIRSAIGDELILRALRQEIVHTVIENDLFDTIIPTLILDAHQTEVEAIISLCDRSVLLVGGLDKKITRETVRKIFAKTGSLQDKPVDSDESTQEGDNK